FFGEIQNIEYRSEEEVRQYIKEQGITSKKEWDEHCSKGKKPPDIPTDLYQVYEGRGFFGRTQKKIEYRSEEEVRQYIKEQGITSRAEWSEHCKKGKKPDDIPRDLYAAYEGRGFFGETRNKNDKSK
ncbi:MAG: hypothetical protein ACJ0RH_01930, partial [Gammaproteobacteria bacterium]